MIIEVSIVSFVILAVGGFWIHRKYPKPIPPPPVDMDTQAFMKKFLKFEEEFKAFKVNYTGNEYIVPFAGGPNG